jgi:hypothetical protein
MPAYLGAKQLLGAEDRDLIDDLCVLRKKAISQGQARLELGQKTAVLLKFLPLLKKLQRQVS